MNPLALIVAAGDQPELVGAATRGLSNRYRIEVLDLDSCGFRAAMSAEERRAYHSETPILDPQISEHAELVREATLLGFVYPTRWWGPPAVVKGWLERVMVPGVSFVLDEGHHVRPNLSNLRAIVGVTAYTQAPTEMRRAGDGGKKIILRALRLNAPGRVKTAWLASPNTEEQFRARVEKRLASI